MKEWEFLLQKEGDRSWLPLDSPAVEILEGRYRIVARSRWANAKVQIRISHLVTEDDPPKRRIQKRSNRTNKDGLMVVIPFTHLEAGLWELHCASTDLMSELVGDAWQFAVKLQVSPCETEADLWEPDWAHPPATPAAAGISHQNGSQPHSLVGSDSGGHVADAIAADMDLVTEDGNLATPSSLKPTPEPLIPTAVPGEQTTELPPEVAELLGASMDRLFQIAEDMSAKLVDDVMRDFDLDPEVSASVRPTPMGSPQTDTPIPSIAISETAPVSYTLAANEVFELQLESEALVASQDEPLTLRGQVKVSAQATLTTDSEAAMGGDRVSNTTAPMTDPWGLEKPSIELTGATAQEVQLYLRDPQTLQILVSDRCPLSGPLPPFPFAFNFTLPANLQTHLLLGEVALCGWLPDQRETLTTLTTQSFTITANPNALVGELEKLSEVLDETLATSADDAQIDLPLELSQRLAKEQAPPLLNLSFLEPEPTAEALSVEPPTQFPSLAGQPLPPQIYHPDPNQPRIKIELPGFREPVPATDAGSTITDTNTDTTTEAAGITPAIANEPDASVLASDPVESEPSAAPVLVTNEATATDQPPVPESESTATEPTADLVPEGDRALEANIDSAAQTASTSPIDLPSPIQMGFQALRLQDRFLRRLNSLATDAELSNWLRNNLYPERTATTDQPTTPPVVDNGRVMEEFVVDDEPANPSGRNRNGNRHGKASANPTADAPNVLVLPEEEPIPTPELDITTGELVSGQLVSIRVRLPDLVPRIYVKLWVTDWQTRSLLDGPRWLLDFLPNGKGQLEALTQLTVPFGSLEVRFEAIAIEMHTQRESHKVGVERLVVPPDLPVVSLEGFDTSP